MQSIDEAREFGEAGAGDGHLRRLEEPFMRMLEAPIRERSLSTAQDKKVDHAAPSIGIYPSLTLIRKYSASLPAVQGFSVMKVLILVCALSLPRTDCQPETARVVLEGPDAGNEIACMLGAQAYLAGSAISVGQDERVKVLCRHSENTGNVG